MTADEIREKAVAKMPFSGPLLGGIDVVQYLEFSCLMLQEIAAQIAEANDLSRFELGLDESNHGLEQADPAEVEQSLGSSDEQLAPAPSAERIVPFFYPEVKTGTLPSTVLPHDFGTSQLGEANQPTEAPAALNTQARPPINPLRSKS